MEFLFVQSPRSADVLANGAAVGRTNQVILLQAGQYLVSLGPPPVTNPAVLGTTVRLLGTAALQPLTIQLT